MQWRDQCDDHTCQDHVKNLLNYIEIGNRNKKEIIMRET